MSVVERAAEVLQAAMTETGVMPDLHYCRATAQTLADAGLLVTDVDRAVLDAAEELIEADKFGGPGEYGYANMALTRAVDALVAARRARRADAAKVQPARGRK